MLRRLTGFLTASGTAQIVGILAGIMQARALGPEGKSVIAYAAVALWMVTVATGGLTNAAMAQAGRDGVSVRLVRAALVRVTLMLGIPIAVAALIVGSFFPSQRPLIYAALAIPFAIYVQGTTGILLAAGATRALIVQNGFATVAFGFVLIPLLIFAKPQPYQALALWTIAWIVAALYGDLACRLLQPKEEGASREVSVRAIVVNQLREGTKNSGALVAAYINLRIDVFVVSVFLGSRDLGLYTLAIAAGEMLWSFSQPIVWANLDRITGAPYAEALALTVRVTRNVLILQVLLGTITLVLGPAAIVMVYGADFAESGIVLQLLVPGLALYTVRELMGSFVLLRLRRPVFLMATQGTSALVCALVSYASLPAFGIRGAAVATSVTYLLVVMVIAAAFCRQTRTSPLALLFPTRDDLRWYRTRFIETLRPLWRLCRLERSVQ